MCCPDFCEYLAYLSWENYLCKKCGFAAARKRNFLSGFDQFGTDLVSIQISFVDMARQSLVKWSRLVFKQKQNSKYGNILKQFNHFFSVFTLID